MENKEAMEEFECVQTKWHLEKCEKCNHKEPIEEKEDWSFSGNITHNEWVNKEPMEEEMSNENWISEFHKIFTGALYPELKNFISSQIKQAEKRGYKEGMIDDGKYNEETIIPNRIKAEREKIVREIDEQLVPNEITASSNPRWTYNKAKKDIINLINKNNE